MYKNYAIENLTETISDDLFKKLKQFVEDKKNSKEVQDKIKKEIHRLEQLEEMVDNMTSSYDFSEFKYSSITVDGNTFEYNKEKDAFEMYESIEEAAKTIIYRNENLYWVSWDVVSKMKARVRGIITTLTPTSFPEVQKIVESQIDFNEIITNN
jgi:hypothetical protein